MSNGFVFSIVLSINHKKISRDKKNWKLDLNLI